MPRERSLFPKITEQGLDDLRRRIGVKITDTLEPWCHEATRDSIRHYAHGIGDDNPLWCDPDYAAGTRWGGVLAPPSFLFATSRIISGYVGGLPGVHAMWAGAEWTWHLPVRRNDTISTEAWLKDLIEHQTTFAGRSIQQVYHVDFYNQRGDLVAAADSWCFRTDRDLAREAGTKYTAVKARPPKRYTDEELADIYRLYASEQIRGSAARYWDDVREGERLPTMAKGPMTVTGFIAYAQGWGGLYIRANKLAWKQVHRHSGLGIKNRFGIPDCPEWIFALFALAKIGAVHVPVNARFRTVDLAQVLERSNAATLIIHDVSGPVDYLGMVRELAALDEAGGHRRVRGARLPDLERVIVVSDRKYPGVWSWPDLLASGSRVEPATLAARAAAIRPTDTVFIMYTSGTTGFPKGVMRDHTLLAHLADRYRRLQSTERDVFLNYLPLFHIFGYIEGPLGSMLTGYRQILTDTFDPDEALDLVEREGVTHIDAFDTHLKLLIDAQEARPRNLATLRTGVIAGGAANATPLVYRARKVLAPLRPLTLTA